MSSNLPAGPETSSAPTHAPPNLIKSTAPLLTTAPPNPSSTFNTLLVVPFSSSLTRFALPDGKGGQKPGGQGRAEAEGEVREEYRRLMDVLVRAGELKVTSRRGTKGDEVWIFIGASEKKIAELAAREKREDFLHSVSSTTRPSSFNATLPASERIRLVYELITTNTLQGGLGITPREGNWRRVEGVMALQDEKANHAWVQSWLGKQWYLGLTSNMTHNEQAVILDNFGPSVALYFSFLNFYAGALVPLTAVGIFFWLGSKGFFAKIATLIGLETWAYTGGLPEAGYGWGWSWLYAAIVGIWGVAVVEMWRIKERKLSVSYGTHRVQTVARLRPQYLSSIAAASGISAPATTATNALSASNSPTDTAFIMRELKIFASVPVLMGLGVLLGGLLTGIFVFEAFLAKLYDGPGKSLLGLVPTLLFVGVIPNVLAVYHSISNRLTHWENHPTKSGHDSSLTVKTFALNSIVAYSGLFLSAFVYVPFGELIMSFFSSTLTHKQNKVGSLSAEQTGLGPKTTVSKRAGAKSDRLGGQVFAYTVTNQAINAFTELGLPYIKQFIQDKRNDKQDRDLGKKTGYEMRDLTSSPEEKKFMKKVERELGLIEYSNFTDYAEMVTQFGYITVWSVVWPLAPLFALINNWVELRGDAIKISTQVRRPIAERVENIGPWLTMMSFITWMAFVTSSTLCYLFRPNLDYPAHNQSINPNYNSTTYSNYGSAFLHAAIEDSIHENPNRTIAEGTAYLPSWIANSTVIRTVLPMFIPSLFVALLASHGYFIVRLSARWAAEKLLWQGSEEARALELSEEAVKKNFLEGRFDDGLGQMGGHRDAHLSIGEGAEMHDAGFWRGNEEGDAVIAETFKSQ